MVGTTATVSIAGGIEQSMAACHRRNCIIECNNRRRDHQLLAERGPTIERAIDHQEDLLDIMPGNIDLAIGSNKTISANHLPGTATGTVQSNAATKRWLAIGRTC